MIDQYNNELDKIKINYDEGINNYNKTKRLESLPIDSTYPAISGALTWVIKLRERITNIRREIAYLDNS